MQIADHMIDLNFRSMLLQYKVLCLSIHRSLWDELVDHCCVSKIPSRETCHFSSNPYPMCISRVTKAMNIVYSSGLNMYNLYSDCVGSSESGFSRYHADAGNLYMHLKRYRAATLLRASHHEVSITFAKFVFLLYSLAFNCEKCEIIYYHDINPNVNK